MLEMLVATDIHSRKTIYFIYTTEVNAAAFQHSSKYVILDSTGKKKKRKFKTIEGW